jgi:hypothetical protein
MITIKPVRTLYDQHNPEAGLYARVYRPARSAGAGRFRTELICTDTGEVLRKRDFVSQIDAEMAADRYVDMQ